MVLIANRLTLSPIFLAEALVAKTTPQYRNESKYKNFSYDKDIYPQARLAFPVYNKRYPDSNEEFVKFFERDLRNKDQELLKVISKGQTEIQSLTDQTGETIGPTSSSEKSAGEPARTMTGGSHLPSISLPTLPAIHNIPQVNPSNIPSKTPVPDAFNKAFENEPDYKTDPTKSAPKAGKTSFQAPRVPASFVNTAKNFGSRAGIFFKKNSGRIAGGLGQIARGVGRGIAGPGLTGAYNLLGKAGTGGINAFANLSNQAAGRGALVRGSSKKIALAFLGALFLFVFGAGLLGGITGTTPVGETSPIGTDLSSCKFTRGQENPKEASFKSNTLLGYIQQASQLSTIPPVVLASFIRVESPNSSNMSDNQIANYSASCAKSPTGALGIMQIQPPGTTSARGDPASCDDCIDAGAKLVGKTVSTMTEQDYCDPKTNIIVGAGWILKKMSKLGYGDGTKWDPEWTNNRTAIEALVNTYYGDVLYPDVNSGPFNYADDVSASIQNCQLQTVPPPANGDLKQSIAGKFGIDFQGSEFTADHLQAAWEVLNQAQQVAPKFFGLLGRGVTATTHSDTSERIGNTIYFSTRPGSFFMRGSPQQFKVLLIHELGHIIRGDPGSTKANNYDQQLQSAVNKDGGYLTGYGENPCYGTPNIDEDFAETVTYYVNKGAKEEDLGCGVKSTNGINPLESGLYPAHLDFIQTELGKP